MKKGKIIVFEGLDHSFKETNAKRLEKYIKQHITDKVLLISFPNYSSPSSMFVKKYLDRQYGNLNEVNVYTRAMFYALDRYDTMKELNIKRLLSKGYYIILDRYVGSNLIFGATEFKTNQYKDKFIKWVTDLEFHRNNLPQENICIYMDMPVDILYDLIQKRKNIIDNDIHESNKYFLKQVEENAKYVCKKLNWNIVNCTEDDKIRTQDEIFDDILNILIKDKNILL